MSDPIQDGVAALDMLMDKAYTQRMPHIPAEPKSWDIEKILAYLALDEALALVRAQRVIDEMTLYTLKESDERRRAFLLTNTIR